LPGSGHNRLLKILHIDPEKNWGGGEAQVFGLLKYLAERGHRNFLASHPDGKLFNRQHHNSVRKIPLILRNDLDLRSIPALRHLIHNENFDLVHLHTKRAHVLALWLPRGSGLPKYVVTRRMDYPERASLYTRLLYNRRVDGVIAISQSIVDSLASAGVVRDRIHLIHSGIDPIPFTTAAKAIKPPNTIPVVGTAAVLEERKGYTALLQAAQILKSEGRDIKYLFAGEGTLKRQLEQLVRTTGLIEDVTFMGFISDVPTFLSGIDIFVMPSLFEGLGVAALEAMAAGKPVVASRVGGLTESIIDGQTGFLVPPNDAGKLAAAIRRLIDDPSLGESMGCRGAERVRKSFSMEQMAKKNESYYYALFEGAAHS
jgi:glycosyltransferase involved in cell wall biosynthesis